MSRPQHECGGQAWPKPDKHIVFPARTQLKSDAFKFVHGFSGTALVRLLCLTPRMTSLIVKLVSSLNNVNY